MMKTTEKKKRQQPSIQLKVSSHIYSVKGVEYISVTQALDEAGAMPWYVKHQYYLDRGRAVHSATQFDDEGDLTDSRLPKYLVPYVEAWRMFRAETGFVPLLIEQKVFSKKYGYAGTLDRVGLLGEEQVVLDIKSGEVVAATAMQTAAYGKAYKPGKRWRRLGVQLKPTGDFKIHEWGADMFERDFADFVACHRIAIWKRRNKIR